MSLPPGTSWAGSHWLFCQASVNSAVYSRVGDTGAWKRPPGVSGLSHASCVLAALPTVLNVGRLVVKSWSQGARAARFSSEPGGVSQPSAAGVTRQQPVTRLAGTWVVSSFSSGLARKYDQRGWGTPTSAPPWSEVVTTPAYAPGPTNGTVGDSNGQTCTW